MCLNWTPYDSCKPEEQFVSAAAYISTYGRPLLSFSHTLWCWQRTNIWDSFFKIRFILESDLLTCIVCSNCTIFAWTNSKVVKQKKGCVRETKRERRKRWEITSMHQVNESSQNTGLNQWQHAWLCMFSQSKEGTVLLGIQPRKLPSWAHYDVAVLNFNSYRVGLFDHSKRKWKWVVSEEFPLKFSHQLRQAGAQQIWQMKLKLWLK